MIRLAWAIEQMEKVEICLLEIAEHGDSHILPHSDEALGYLRAGLAELRGETAEYSLAEEKDSQSESLQLDREV